MANFFDQFDEPKTRSKEKLVNFFDQFDEPTDARAQAATSTAPIEQPDDPNRSVLADWTKFGGAIGTRLLSSVPEGAVDVATGLARPAFTGEYIERGPIGVQLFNKAISLVRNAFGTSLEKQEQEKLATKIAADKSITEVKDLFELPRFFEYLSETGKEVSKNLIESTSPQFQRKLKGSEPKGNILKAIKEGNFSEFSFGDNPTIEGYLANTAQGLGSVAPVVATYLITKSPGAAGAVGAGLTAGEASDTAKTYIKSKTDAELLVDSPYYANLRNSGMSEKEARRILSDRAEENAAILQATVAAFGGIATSKIIGGAADKLITGQARSRLRSIAMGTAVGAAEEGAQEFLEGIAADIGINKEVVREIGTDSFANLVLGALGGGPIGGGRGFVAPLGKRKATDQFDADIKKAEEDFLTTQKTKQAAITEEEGKEDPLKDADPALIDEVKKYIEEVETSPKDTETNIAKVLRNYATRLNLDPKKGGKSQSKLINYINRAIETHEGPKPPSPEKIQEVSDYLQGLNTGTITDTGGSLFKKLNALAGRSSGLGISLEAGQKRNTENLLNALAKATGVDLGDYFKRSGTGPSVPGGPARVGTAAGTTPPQQPPVDTTGSTAGAPPGGAGVSDTSVIDDLKNIWKSSDGLPIGLGGLNARDKKLIEGVNRARQAGVIDQVPAEIIDYVGKLSKGRTRRYQLQDDGTVEELATGPGKTLYLDESGAMSAEEEISAIKDFYNRLVESFTKVREEGKEGTRAGLPTDWDALNLDERQLFLDALGREQAGRAPLSQRFRDAFDKLTQYRRTKASYAKQANVRYDTRMDALASYEIDRETESNARGVEFPTWTELNKQQQDAYLAKVPMTSGRAAAGATGEQSRAGFDAVEALLEKPIQEKATDEAYTRAQQEIEEEELGLKTPLPQDVQEDVKAGRLGAVLDYLSNFARGVSKGTLPATGGVRATPGTVSATQLDKANNELAAAEKELSDLERLYVEQADERNRLETELETAKGKDANNLRDQLDNLVSEEDIDDAKGQVYTLNKSISQGQIKVDPVTSAVNRLVAGVLNKTLKNTKLVYLTNAQIKGRGKNPDEFIGEYDPKTDTMYIGERGLNETTMLHESSHAATVAVIYKYLTGKRNELTPDQIRGVVQIIRIYNQTKASLGGRFPNAYANVYEFVAYATSVPKFQLALQNLKVKKEVVPVKEGEQQVFIDPIVYTNFFQTEADIKTQEEKAQKKVDQDISVWQKFTQAMAQAIGLTYRFGRLIRNKITPQEYFDSVRKKTTKEVTESLETAEDQDGYQTFLEEVFGQPKKVKEGGRDEKLIKRLEKDLAKAESEYGAVLENTRRLEERMKEMSLADRNKDPDYKAQKSKESAAFDKINGIRDELYDAGAIEYAPKETKGERRKRESVSVEPGYLGNAFLEMMGAFNDIAAAPPELGIPEFAVELPIKLTKAKKAPAIKQPTYKDNLERKADRMRSSRKTLKSRAQAVYKFFKQPSKEVWLDTVRLLQNTRAYLYDLQETLSRAGALVSSGDKQNNTATASTAAGSIGENVFQRKYYKIQKEIQDLLIEIADAYNSDIEFVLARLHTYAIFLHDPERRIIKWLKEAPLTNVQAVTARDALVKQVLAIKRKSFKDPAADAQAVALRQQLEALVNTNLDKNSKYADPNNEKYNTLGPESKDYIDNVFGKVYAADPKVKDGTVGRMFDKLRRMDDITRSLNQESNYYSDPVANLVAFYGFKNYFSFKGRPDIGAKDYQLDPYNQQLSGELQDKQEAFDGRITDSDNPIINFFVEAVRASRRVGRHRAGLELTIKNNIENYKKGDLGFKGKHIKKVSFEEQFDKALNAELKRGVKNIFVRNKDGSVDIYEISDPKILNAIKKPIQQHGNFIDTGLNVANYLTSLMGQYHTRYNLAFAPVDFIRNSLSYAGVISAQVGPVEAAKLVSEIATMMVMERSIPKTAKYSYAYSSGNTAKLRSMEKSNPYYQDLKRYYELGGRVAYMQAVSYKDNLAEVIKHVDKNGMITAKEGLDRFLDAYLDMFEMSTRIAAYRVMRDKYMSDNMSKQDAEIEAAAFAKNLANFEQIGELGRVGGAMYMFYRPTATGAVRAIEAVYPAFDFRSEKSIKQAMRKSERYGTMSLEQIKKAYEKYNKQRMNARITLGAALGFGYTMYMLAFASSGDDDEGRNKVLTDDTARWVRTARFNTGLKVNGKDLVIQIPWGFGVGAFASIGAQFGALSMGAQSFSKFMANVFDAAMESFMPVQISKIEKSSFPVQSFVDSITPSLLRPPVQFAMNMDSFGREIYAGRTGRVLDSYTANDSVPEIYRDAARNLYDLTGADVSPNTMYFLVNNYVDGLGRVTSFLYNWLNIARGDKNFDIKSDTLVMDAFFKTTSNYDSRQFSDVEKKIREMMKRYKAAEADPEKLDKYLMSNPYDKQIIDYYNKFLAGDIKKIRTELNRIRESNMSQKERESEIRALMKHQDYLKAAFISVLDDPELKPSEPMIPRTKR